MAARTRTALRPTRVAELKRAYKEAPRQAGVWQIKNLRSGKVLFDSGPVFATWAPRRRRDYRREWAENALCPP